MEEQNNTNQQPEIVVGAKPATVSLNWKSKLGILFFNLAIVCIVMVGISLISPIVTLFYYLILLLLMLFIIVITLGLIFVAAPNTISGLWNAITKGGLFLEKVSEFLLSAMPYFLGVCIGLSVLALIMFLINKKVHKHSVRIGFAIAFAVIATVGLIVLVF